MTAIELAAKEYAKFKPLEGGKERHAAYKALVKALKEHDDYQREYMEGYRASNGRGKNPFNYDKEPAKWQGYYDAEKTLDGLADEQS